MCVHDVRYTSRVGGECDCVGAFMPPLFDSSGPAPSRRSAGV